MCFFPDIRDVSRRRPYRFLFDEPQGIPDRIGFMLLTMDRTNFPGMPSPSWTYGAMYFYQGHPVP